MEREGRTLGRVNPTHFVTTWRAMIDAALGVVFLSVQNGECDGIASGIINRCMVTGAVTFHTQTAYAKRGHRNPFMPLRMLRQMENWAGAHGARVMFTGALANDDRDTVEFLKRMGYKPSDQAFVKGL
jgi:hypothetical protein